MSDFDLTPGDFRRAWPRALQRAFEQASVAIEAAQSMDDNLRDTKAKVIELAKLTPLMMLQAESKLKDATDRVIVQHEKATTSSLNKLLTIVETAVSALEQANTELINSHLKLMKTFQDERAALESERAQKEKFLAKIHQDQFKLENARREFNSMSLWRRIFTPPRARMTCITSLSPFSEERGHHASTTFI